MCTVIICLHRKRPPTFSACHPVLISVIFISKSKEVFLCNGKDGGRGGVGVDGNSSGAAYTFLQYHQ